MGGTVEERGFDLQVTAGGVHELLREAYRTLPDVAELELVEMLAGLRPGTPDNAPLIGPGALDGLVLATGHYRNGILLTPFTAEAVAAMLAGDPVPPEARAGASRPIRRGERAGVGRRQRGGRGAIVIVELNGQTEQLPDDATVADAVKAVGVNGETRGVAVAVDGEVVRRADWVTTPLADRQAIEVVRAVQGG